jgi:hypothetical protein
MLAQTCSQIGADSLSSKILSTTEKLKSSSSSSSTSSSSSSSSGRHHDGGKNGGGGDGHKKDGASPNINVSDMSGGGNKTVAFKPYASEESGKSYHRHHANGSLGTVSPKGAAAHLQPPPHHSAGSPLMRTTAAASPSETKDAATASPKTPMGATTPTSSSGASPLIQSGLEVLGGHHAKDSSLHAKVSIIPAYYADLCCGFGILCFSTSWSRDAFYPGSRIRPIFV